MPTENPRFQTIKDAVQERPDSPAKPVSPTAEASTCADRDTEPTVYTKPASVRQARWRAKKAAALNVEQAA